eukprot:TRINITY_DN8542_c0_g1_i4.p1 TRINITY_DN8542_c0_g1~~TRINITY_DN8542_c0_g1_i4.p1  ORF type:complete len:105 (-),score=24.97 TRINITY_DN8542_c0_g1_i4:52-366(-)
MVDAITFQDQILNRYADLEALTKESLKGLGLINAYFENFSNTLEDFVPALTKLLTPIANFLEESKGKHSSLLAALNVFVKKEEEFHGLMLDLSLIHISEPTRPY